MKQQDQPERAVAVSAEMDAGAIAFTVLLCILFGANATAIKISLTGIGVFTTAAIRFGVAALVIYIWARATGKPVRIDAWQLRHMLVLGVIFYLQLALFYLGLSRTTASHGTLISNILPFVVLVLAHFFIAAERVSLRKLSGLTLGFCGVLILFTDTGGLERKMLIGDLCVLASVLIWGGNAIYTKRIIGAFHPSQITLYPVAISAPLFLVSGFFLDGEMVRMVNGPIVAAMAYQTLVTASFGLIGWTMMIKRFGATTLHSFVFLMPISGVFFGVVMLGEELTGRLIGSIVLVTAGLIVVNRGLRGLGQRRYFPHIFPGKH